MSQRNDLAEKKRLLVDGIEIPDLVYVGAVEMEKDVIEVPEFAKKRNIQNGVTKIPMVQVKYKIAKGGTALATIRNWYLNNEVHDLTILRCDATGTEFARDLAPGAECIKFSEPDYDAASPKFAQLEATFIPFDFTPMDALA
jgi:hypothetical protein